MKNQIDLLVNNRKEELILLSDSIHSYAEPYFQEFKSCALLISFFSKNGFEIEENVCNLPTAFVATFSNGGNTIGFLGEYDALEQLSQEGGTTYEKPVEGCEYGHGCGHNLLGVGSAGAAVAMKEYLVANSITGSVKYFGCPAEENCGGKVYMAKAGVFSSCDALFTWHPSDINAVTGCSSLAMSGMTFSFKGVSAHAGNAPHTGRSALDAAELMNVGVQYLREHIVPEARMHYAYIDAGGKAPNVVQASCKLHYFIRAPKVSIVQEISQRVLNIAKGAALMTDTTVEREIIDTFCDYIPNNILSKLLFDCMVNAGSPDFSVADFALAKEFASTISKDIREQNIKTVLGGQKENFSEYQDEILDKSIAEYFYNPKYSQGGSTDVADASYCVPTAEARVATAAVGTGHHTWQMTGQVGCSIGHKGMLFAAKVLAAAGVVAVQSSEILQAAKLEHSQSCPNGYSFV